MRHLLKHLPGEVSGAVRTVREPGVRLRCCLDVRQDLR
ncbi:DUF6207 family protein [Streptomyces sp. NPDC093094]